MRRTNDPIEHCRSHIERTRAALRRREALGRDTYDLRRHLKTLEALLTIHKAARDAAPARPKQAIAEKSSGRFMIRSRTRVVKRHPEGNW